MRIGNVLVCHSYDPARLFESVGRDDASWYVFLHGARDDIAGRVKRFMSGRRGEMFPYKSNRGLALSWNDAILRSLDDGCDAVLLLNDDLFFLGGGYERFLAAANDLVWGRQASALVTVHGLETGQSANAGKVVAQGFSCCLIVRRAFDTIGLFDENFSPAYYEDCDFFRRFLLAGLPVAEVPECLVEHERSSTIGGLGADERDALVSSMAMSRAYYIQKWGGDAGSETFAAPFDGAFGLKIARERRHAPYAPAWGRGGRL